MEKQFTSGIDIWKSSEASKNERAKINGVIKAKEIELQTALANGEITQKQLETQLAIVKAQKPSTYFKRDFICCWWCILLAE